jgi:hypothetical protein
MPIPTGTAAISFSQLRDEMRIGLGDSGAYGAFPLNDATVREKITDTSVGNSVSLSSLRGNTYRRFTIAADTVNYDIRTVFGNSGSGWPGSSKASVDVVVNGGVIVGSNTTSAYAMDTGATGWPAPSTITVINNGYIIGHGGNGGPGGDSPGSAGAGTAGGPALLARRPMKLTNNSSPNGGIVGGGGGGGGGAPGTSTSFTTSPPVPPTAPSYPTSPGPITTFSRYGGGAGGGGRTARLPTSGGAFGNATGPGNLFDSNAGAPGTFAGAGAGSGGRGPAGAGGNGGDWGTAGAPGAPGSQAGGAAGISIQGWTQVSTPVALGSTGISGPSTAG